MPRTFYRDDKNGVNDPSGKIAAWQIAQTDLVHAGGLAETSWGQDTSWNIDDTFIDPGYAFRQDGLLRQVTVQLSTHANTGVTGKIKIFRLNAATTYDFVAEQVFTPTKGLTHQKYTITINPPIAVKMGDVPGIYFYSSGNFSTVDAKSLPGLVRKTLYVTGDIIAQADFTSNHNSHLSMEGFMLAPYLAVTGDSIPAGHGGIIPWNTGLENGAVPPYTVPGGDPTSEPPHMLRLSIGSGAVLQYQNLSMGSQTFAWVASTGIIAAHACKSNAIIIHCGINDVFTDRAWADVLTDLNTIKAAITTERLFICEILPSTNSTDARAANIRNVFNPGLASFCAANGVTLIPMWAAFGQLRPATGFNDNILPSHSQDGTHLSAVGAAAWAEICKASI